MFGKRRAFTTAALAALASAAGVAVSSDASAQATTTWSGAPRTNEEDRQFKINGRIQYDIANIEVDNSAGADLGYNRSYARRAFIGVEGRFTQQWRYNVKFDLAPGSDDNLNEVKLDDAYLEYAAEDWSAQIGQNNFVAHMEDRTSSNYTPFNERASMSQAFDLGKVMGLGFVMVGGNWTAGLGVYGNSLNELETQNSDEQTAVIARGTWAPIYSRTPDGVTFLHLGLSGRVREGGGVSGVTANTLRYRARPNVNIGDRFIDTAAIFDRDTQYGAEAAFQWNAFGATVEYTRVEASPDAPTPANPQREFDGYYVDLFWSPTGEGRTYVAADGSWGRVTPRRTLGSDGGIGHIMLSARYDYLNLNDGTLDGGEQTGYIAGVTWAPISYVKFQLNYAMYDIERNASAVTAEADTITLRTQFDW